MENKQKIIIRHATRPLIEHAILASQLNWLLEEKFHKVRTRNVFDLNHLSASFGGL